MDVLLIRQGNAMSYENQTVYILDDDPHIRESLTTLLQSRGFHVKVYPSARDFISLYDPSISGCLLLDLNLPGTSGLELQKILQKKGHDIPIIFITGSADVPSAVSAVKAGAFDYLLKPYDPRRLLSCIRLALARDLALRRQYNMLTELQERLQRLTPREREVMQFIIDGKPNKVIAVELNLSPRTVEIHRSNVMQKMQVDSLAELVKQAAVVENRLH